ncbi:MAG: phosphogluconate dehydrogenase (NAD(+)-dependent, decarboxylating) [Rhizobacter sp.]
MQIGMVGMGRMGGNMARRLMRAGHECVIHDLNLEAMEQLRGDGATMALDLDELAAALKPPRAVWLMLPHGSITDQTVAALGRCLAPGDVVVDGGNTHYHDDIRRERDLRALGIGYVDVGTSGGVWGLERGYCLMVGGEPAAVQRLAPVFEALAPGADRAERTSADVQESSAERGWLHCGPSGSGHFVKMVHNGIEYGMMQALAEGFDVMRAAAKPEIPAERRYDLDLAQIAEVWRRGSVLSSWLLDLTARALAEDPLLLGFTGVVPDSGEGRWTIQAAIEESVPVTVLTAALYARFRSRQDPSFADKVLSALRYQFGGHAEGRRGVPDA